MALDITSYALGKKAGGGGDEPTGTITITENGLTNVKDYATADVNVEPDLESKNVTITENTTTSITPTSGKDGLSEVNITTNIQPNLETKSVTITENKTTTITPTSGKDGISSIEITTNVPSSGNEWADIGYSETPDYIEAYGATAHAYAKQIYDNWDADNPVKFTSDQNLIIFPIVDTSKMTDMSSMFKSCWNLRELKGLDTSNVTNMNGMFNESGYLTYADFSSFDTSKVTNMQSMFRYNSKSIQKIDVSSFDTSRVSNMTFMFALNTSLTTINFGNKFNLTSATNMSNMFMSCNALNDNTLNQILHICSTATSLDSSNKNTTYIGITSSTLLAKIPTLSNYQEFIDAGWTVS